MTFHDTTVNLNVRISKRLKDDSSSLLLSMGTNQSQFVREALQYVVEHNSLPWQQGNVNSIYYKYSVNMGEFHETVRQASMGSAIDGNHIFSVCAKLDDLQLYAISLLEGYYAHGMTSIPISRLSNLLAQLTSLLRHNATPLNSTSYRYDPMISNRLRLLIDQVDATIRSNSL